MAQENNTLSAADYLVFAFVLFVSAGIGVFYGCTGGKQKTTAEFLMADRAMPVLPVTLSLLASFLSAITLLGTPAEIYVYGSQYWMIWLGYIIMIPLSAHVYHPVFFKLKLTSIFEYLELRFSRGIRTFAVIIYIVKMVLYLAIVLYAPSLALNAVTGFNTWAAVLSVGAVCTFYTTLGGMKAVMWTDVFQICTMFAGLLAVLIRGSMDQGGFTKIWKYMEAGNRIEFLNFDPDPRVRHSFWTLTFGGAFTWLSIYGVNQSQVQRSMTLPRLRNAKIAIWLNLIGLTALLTICSLCGMVVYAEYRNCDPLSTDRIQGMDQLLPLYVMDRLSVPGLPGLFTACLFSGGLSTISSGLNSLSAVTLQDLVRNFCFKEMSEEKATLVSKCLALGYGIIMIALTFVAAQLGGVLQAALALFGMLGGPLLGLYTLGIIYPWCNTKGAYVGLSMGLLFTLWLGIGAQVHKPNVHKPPVSVAGCPMSNATTLMEMTSPLTPYVTSGVASEPDHEAGYLSFYEISYLYYSACAVFVVTFVGLLVSILTGPNRPQDIDPKLLCPILYDAFCCLPAGVRAALRCNIRFSDNQVSKMVVTQTGLQQEDSNKPSVATSGFFNPAADIDVYVTPLKQIQYETSI